MLADARWLSTFYEAETQEMCVHDGGHVLPDDPSEVVRFIRKFATEATPAASTPAAPTSAPIRLVEVQVSSALQT